MKPLENLCCLYYPYSRPHKLNTIKRAILLFDEIAFVDSQPSFLREHVLRDDVNRFERGAELADEINSVCRMLENEGVLRIIDSAPVLSEFGEVVTSAVAGDVANDGFVYASLQNNVAVWDIARERLPEGFIEAFYPGAGTFSEAISLQALVHAEGSLENVKERFRKFAAFRYPRMDKEKAWQAFDRYRFVIGGNPHVLMEAYSISDLHASSLRINEALLLAETIDFITFTDSTHHDTLLQIKVASYQKQRGSLDRAHGFAESCEACSRDEIERCCLQRTCS